MTPRPAGSHDDPSGDPPDDPPNRPHVIAQYRLEALVHEGANARVFRAVDETLKRTVALKVLAESTHALSLLEEARAVSTLKHPAIANVYQAGFDERSAASFIAFEWVEGETLRARLRRGPLAPAEFARVARDIAAAVAHAHEHALVHGDLKADNVVLAGNGSVKLIDFGLSRPLGAARDHELWGTPAYMAPELFTGASRSEASDLFALGVLFYEMATGELPFGGADGNERTVIARLASAEAPQDPRVVAPETPVAIATVIASLLRRRPEDRGPGAAELARLLRLRADSEPRAPRPRSRARWWVAVVGLLGVGAASWWLRDDLRSVAARWGLGSQPQVRLAEVRVGALRDPGLGEVSSASQFGADLVNLFLHEDDPGSSLLALAVDDRAGADATPATAATDVILEGEWGFVDGQWRARLQVPASRTGLAAVGVDGVLELSDADSVRLALRVAQALADPSRAPGGVATTLCESERALVRFVTGVRALEAGEFAAAAVEFEEAQREGKYFLEAEAWGAAAALLLGQDQVAAARIQARREIRSRPGSVLAAVLAAPRTDPRARWGAPHRAARAVDLVLAAMDPHTTDEELRARLTQTPGASARVLALEVDLALRAGDAVRAGERLLFFRGRGGTSWEEVVLRRRLLRLVGRAEAGDDELADWLLDVYDRTPGSFLRIPFQLANGKLTRAVQLARRQGYVDAAAIPAAAMTLAIGGEFDEAAAVARGIRDPFDPGAAERALAAIAWLRGDAVATRTFLASALRLDPADPKAAFLTEYIDADPLALVSAAPAEPTSFGRWRAGFERLARARQERLADRSAEALRELDAMPWVTDDLEVVDWPELAYWIRLERIDAHLDLRDRDAAASEWETFCEWWPGDRSGASRLGQRAVEVENRMRRP
ncbi:MAG: protein kinase [Planctomycetota bacterium]